MDSENHNNENNIENEDSVGSKVGGCLLWILFLIIVNIILAASGSDWFV